MNQQEAQEVLDRLIDDAACIMSAERWDELMTCISVLLPESRFASNDR